MRAKRVDTVTAKCESLERAAGRRVKKTVKINRTPEEKAALLAYIFGGSSVDTVSSCAPIGGHNDKPIKMGKSTGVWKKQSNRDIAENDERIKNGLVVKFKGVDYKKQILADNREVKTCGCCQTTWNVSNFSTDNLQEDKLKTTCKDCDRVRDQKRVYIPVSQRSKTAQKVA